MWFRLALALGMSVKRAQAEIDSAEFAEWWAYYDIEPFGQERDNLHAAMIASVAANAAGAKTKITDFMLKIKEAVVRQTPAQIMAVLTMFTQWFNGSENNGGSDAEPDGG